MKLSVQNKVRTEIITDIFDYFTNKSEDCGMIESNAFNFPIVTEDGEEGFIEIWVKMPKGDSDDQYLKRTMYTDKVRERTEKAEAAAKVKAEKIAKAKAAKEAKAASKANFKAE